jgi:hypothetical protein
MSTSASRTTTAALPPLDRMDARIGGDDHWILADPRQDPAPRNRSIVKPAA